MRVKVTAVGYYDLPDDPKKLQHAWNTTDHDEALLVDQEVFNDDVGMALDTVDWEDFKCEFIGDDA